MFIEEDLERCRQRMGRQVVCDELGAVMRLRRYVGGIWAMSRRWGRSQARTGSLDSIRKSDRA